jgi:NADH-quinone oxidoreductase subunit J
VTEKILFLVFSAFAVLGGIATVTWRNVVHGLLFLVFTLLNVAALFFLSQAYFLAVIQILVYAGAIMVLFFFVVMLLNLRNFQEQEQVHRKQRWLALGLSVLVLAEFVVVLAGITFTSAHGGFSPDAIANAGGGTRAFGEVLFDRMLLPFEVASVVLLVAMVGAIVLVRRERAAGVATRTWGPGEEPSPDSTEEEV